jgi:hypothetical protein
MNRAALYPILNVGVLLAVLAGSTVHGAAPGLAVYVCVLFGLCSAPILLLRSFHDRYALLAIFMALYFLFFGALDLSTLLLGSDLPQAARVGFLSAAELAILLGAGLVLAGYAGGVRLGRGSNDGVPPAEWSPGVMLFLGLTLWVIGTAAMLYFQVFAFPEKSDRAAHNAFENMGPVLTFFVMLGIMIQPLGVLVLAYGYARQRSSVPWFALIIAVVAIDVGVGFVTDIKRTALMGGALVVMTRTIVDNRLPKAWILSSVLMIALTFPLFQAYRTQIEGERGLDRAHAFQELDKVLEIVFASSGKAERAVDPNERAQTFLERSSVKGNVQMLFAHAGVDVPLLGGKSLVALPLAFVPRMLVPDKGDVVAGQLFTRQILKDPSDTYISISHLGEWYWNFGWPGVLLGMSFTGLLLGFVGEKFNLEQGTSVTRVLMLLVTAQTLCIGFEGAIEISYTIWLRSIAAVGLFHLTLARSGGARNPTVPGDAAVQSGQPVAPTTGALVAARVATPRFSNLMR